MIDRNMLAKMKMLDEATLTKEFGRDVTKDEIQGLLARRDLIVKFFDKRAKARYSIGPAGIRDERIRN